MDDPGWSWPAWKFGMKRDALFTTLHDQYNTFQSTIQDPDAFHHDVYEISMSARTTSEFHRLLAGRREQRLRELNESLESASFEIIANPALIGTTQWEYALQLFRTRSLDSLVRYFASYLPSEHPWHVPMKDGKDQDKSIPIKPIFDDALTTEPMSIPHSLSQTSIPHQLPPSPRSLTTYSDDSDSQVHEVYYLDALTPARTLSSDSEHDQDDVLIIDHHVVDVDRDQFITTAANSPEPKVDDCPSQCHDDESSQSSGPDTPASVSEMGDEPEVTEIRKVAAPIPAVDIVDLTTEDSAVTTADTGCPSQMPATPPKTTPNTTPKAKSKATPKSAPTRPAVPCHLASGFAIDAISKPSPLAVSMRLRNRSASPSRPWPLVHAAVHHPGDDRGRSCRLSTRLAHLEHGNLSSQQSYDQRSRRATSRRRHQLAGGVEKPGPRSMRSRLRERREAVGTIGTRGR